MVSIGSARSIIIHSSSNSSRGCLVDSLCLTSYSSLRYSGGSAPWYLDGVSGNLYSGNIKNSENSCAIYYFEGPAEVRRGTHQLSSCRAPFNTTSSSLLLLSSPIRA